MVVEFLQSLQEKFTSEKFDKKEELDFIATKIRETEKFIHLMEAETEQPFSDFSPRTINSKSQERLEELRQGLSDLTAQRNHIVSEIESLDAWLADIESSMAEVRSTSKGETPVVSSIPKSPGMEELIKQLTEVNRLLPLDPMRAKLELTKLISKIS
ncbi:MAG: hypothetical protein K6G04_00745 [Lachnospiraceae bacterium]|nr:hypothetical protein [Lachnospiraceae bacterium]